MSINKLSKKNILNIVNILKRTYPNACCNLQYDNPYQFFVAAILSARCTDYKVNQITPIFFINFPDFKTLATSDIEYIASIIRPIGLYHNKAKNLHKTANVITHCYNGKIPMIKKNLMQLPGVGNKTANILLANLFNIPQFAVDTHVFRISQRIGLSTSKTSIGVEQDLCKIFSKPNWISLHNQLILHGKTICYSKKPKCQECSIITFCKFPLIT